MMWGSKHLVEIIKQLRNKIEMEEPAALQKYLGCVHHISQKLVKGETITSIEFDMTKYFESAIEQYLELAVDKLTKAASPYAPKVSSEELDELLAQEGRMAPHAASLVMKLMYGVRMAAPHLSVAIGRLASQISKWTRESDRKLHRVYSYLKEASNLTLKGYLSTEDLSNVEIVAWPDADLCGDFMSTKSTSGFFMEVRGMNGRGMPVSWGSKKQGCTAQHTAEAEVVSMASCMRSELLPAQFLLQKLLRRAVNTKVMEDNNACITSVEKGYSPSMRHLPRTQKVSIGMLHEMIQSEATEVDGKVEVLKAKSEEHLGDVMTKELEVCKFEKAVEMLRISELGKFINAGE